jgi:hypothetical protein
LAVANELYSDGAAVDPPDIRPLGWLAMLAYGLLYRSTHPAHRDMLELRRLLTIQRRNERAAMKAVKKQVLQEAEWFGQIIIATWERLRYYHRARSELDAPTRTKKGRKDQVKFAAVVASDLEIYYKILTRKRGFFKYRSALPYRVRVLDLINPETIEELSLSCDRRVVHVPTDYNDGVWIAVQRLKGMDGIPSRVHFSHLIKYLQGDPEDVPVVLGVGQHRIVHSLNLADYPHALIGGSAGSGKSNIVNTLICTIMRTCRATDARFILIDLKMGMEFNFYRHAVHLERPVVVDEAGAIRVLQEAYNLMQERMKLLSEANCKKIAEWNERHPERRMHRLFIIIDEWAEIALSNTKGVPAAAENLAARISNLGRAPGVHLILCTQRPAADIIKNSIKINMPLIVAGRVQSEMQNRVMLNAGRADQLPKVKGRMIYETGQDSIIIQTPLITDVDIVYSIQIARGKNVGVIELVDQEPVIDFNGLIHWLAQRGGKVSRERGDELREYAISASMWKNFVQALEKDGKLIRRWNGYWLADMPDVAPSVFALPEPPLQPAGGDTQPFAPQLPPGEPVQVEVPITNTPAPVKVIEILNQDEVLQRFVIDRCSFSPNARTSSDDLYKEYMAYCTTRDFKAYGSLKDFAGNLKGMFPHLDRIQFYNPDKKRVRGFQGIALKADSTDGTHGSENADGSHKNGDIAA